MIAAISNVHGNLKALASAFGEIEKLKEKGKNIRKIVVIGIFGFMPYPKEVYKMLSNADNVLCVRGYIDHLIAKWSDMSEEEKEEFKKENPIAKTVEWNWESMGRDARKWLRNDVPALLFEKFGDNDFAFSYGEPFNIDVEVLPKKPLSYYESIMASIKKYEMLVVAGYEPFVAETTYGKVACPGGAGVHKKGSHPSFAIIDTASLDVSFYKFDYSKREVEETLKEVKPPKYMEIIDILYHGI